MRISTKDLKKKVTYYLTYDYWPKGGTPVTLVLFAPAKTVWPGSRGDAAKVKSKDGEEFWIHPKACLFDEVPNAAIQGTERSEVPSGMES